MSAATSTNAALPFTPLLSPQPLARDVEVDHRPQTPAMATLNDEPDDRATEAVVPDVVYTPATTVTSCNNSANGENSPETHDRSSAAWSEWWNTEALTAQVRDLTQELSEVKEMVAKQQAHNENTAEQVDDLLRLKENHRASLASLADTHRSEIANVSSSHREEMMKLEMRHIQELRTAKRNHGYDRQLVQGLHESYSRQIENLVLDLSESRRNLKELQLQSTLSASSHSTRNEQASNRLLSVTVEFRDLDEVLSTTQLTIPHPGPTFDSLVKCLRLFVTNYFQTLRAATNFFAGDSKAIHEAQKISHWHRWALADRIEFKFLSNDAVENSSMEHMWETKLWKDNELELEVVCVADPYGDGSYSYPEWRTNEVPTSDTCTTPTPEQLVSVEDGATGELDPAAELARIDEEIGKLQISNQDRERQARFTFKLEQTTLEEHHRENYARNRQPTVQSVDDEDDPPIRMTEESRVGVAVSTSPTFQQKKSRLSQELELDTFLPHSGVNDSGDVLEKFLEKECTEDAHIKPGPKSSDSWNFDEIFSPLPAEKATARLEEGGNTVESLDESGPQEKESSRFSAALTSAEAHLKRNGIPEQEWRWIVGSDALRSPPIPMSGDSSRRDTSYYDAENGSAFGTFKQEAMDHVDRLHRSGSNSFRGEEQTSQYNRERPYFNLVNASSPAPPPAPEPSGRDSPTIPASIQPDMESLGARLDEQYINEDPMLGEAQDDPFADFKAAPCDTPIMDTSRSAASTTPLLDDDATGRKSGPFSPLPSEPLSAEPTGRRGPPSFAPLSGSPKDDHSQNSKSSASRFSGYNFRKNGDGSAPKSDNGRWEERSESSASTIENWESGSADGQKKCGRGDGSEAYTWRRGSNEDEYRRSRRVSPPPSRSSTTTTTDRHSEFPPHPNLYQQNYQQHMGSNNGSNMGAFRYGPRPPLGPQAVFGMMHPGQAAQAELLRLKRMNEIALANARLGPRSSGAPSFSGAPVYAPNPPHSVTTYNGGIPMDPSFMNGGLNAPQQMPYDIPWLLHSPAFVPPGMPGPMWNGSEPRRSYSNDSMLWKLDGHSEGVTQVMPPPMLPPQAGLVPQAPPAAGSIIDQQPPNNYPTPLPGPWPPMGGNFGQPGTPGSRMNMQNHPSPSWYSGPPDMWGGSPIFGGWN